MRKSKVIAGALSFVMAGSMVFAGTASAASGKIKISGSTSAAAHGESFSLQFSLEDIPTAGINACEFAVKYDRNKVSVTSVAAGELTQTGAENVDSTSADVPLFDYYINSTQGTVNIVWSTGADSSVWLKGSGVLFTIGGTVLNSAQSGETLFSIAPIDRPAYPGAAARNDKIIVGNYNGTTKNTYDYELTSGKLNIGSLGLVEYGDANTDGKVDIGDVIKVRNYVLTPSDVPGEDGYISAQGKVNANVAERDTTGVNVTDALAIQRSLVGGTLPLND